MDTFVPPAAIIAAPTSDTDPRVNVAKFGDGYSQRSGDGLNADAQTFVGQFVPVKPDIATAILSFFKAHKSTAFLWKLPCDPTARKWIASKWSVSYPTTGRQAISFTFTEVFDL
jgi:phage-related protein